MLIINIYKGDKWNEDLEIFENLDQDVELRLEHSLISIAKWESKWHKPYLSNTDKSDEEMKDYVRCMTINGNVPDVAYDFLSSKDYKNIGEYIEDPMSASNIIMCKNKKTPGVFAGNEVTSDKIYYWMVAFNIPPEYQKWHLNRLLNLIYICNEENKEPEKMSRNELLRRNSELNAARKKMLGVNE